MKLHHSTLFVALMLVAAGLLGLAAKVAKPIAPFVSRLLSPWADDLERMTVAYAVVNTKSTIVTNADANDLTPALINHGRLREQVAVVAVAAADDNDSVFRFARVWSGWRISSVEIAADALGTGAVYEIGVHDIAANGGAVVDADEFASGVDLAAAKALTDVTNEAAATDIAKAQMALWERLGLTEDPKKWYDITATATAAGTAAGDIMLRVRYVDGT